MTNVYPGILALGMYQGAELIEIIVSVTLITVHSLLWSILYMDLKSEI